MENFTSITLNVTEILALLGVAFLVALSGAVGFTLVFPRAGFTDSLALGSLAWVSVLICQGMASVAVRPSSPSSRHPITTQAVYAMGYRLQMIRANAQRVFAQVIEFLTRGNRPVGGLEVDTMGPTNWLTTTPNFPISVGALANPLPAPGLTDDISRRVASPFTTANVVLDERPDHGLKSTHFWSIHHGL